MPKVKLGPQTAVYPMPALLIGADVDGKANFMTAAWAGIVCSQPPTLGVSFQKNRHTLKGLRQTGTFSANVPREDQIREADYCGIAGGRRVDKAGVCGFNVFYGVLENAPLIAECPLNLECRVTREIHLGSHYLVLGEIVETHVSEACLTDGQPDVTKIKPLCYAEGGHDSYHGVGPELGVAFKVGKALARKWGRTFTSSPNSAPTCHTARTSVSDRGE